MSTFFGFVNRIRETTATTGTGAVLQVPGTNVAASYEPMSSISGDGLAVSDVDYIIEDTAADKWETGRGTYDGAAAGTFTREAVYASSDQRNSTTFINLSGSAVIMVGQAANHFRTSPCPKNVAFDMVGATDTDGILNRLLAFDISLLSATVTLPPDRGQLTYGDKFGFYVAKQPDGSLNVGAQHVSIADTEYIDGRTNLSKTYRLFRTGEFMEFEYNPNATGNLRWTVSIDGRKPAIAQVFKATDQGCQNSTWTTLTDYSTRATDTINMADRVSTFTVRRSGDYYVNAAGLWQINNTGERVQRILRNGETIMQQRANVSASGSLEFSNGNQVRLVEGDVLTHQVLHTAGTIIDIRGLNGTRTSFSVHEVLDGGLSYVGS